LVLAVLAVSWLFEADSRDDEGWRSQAGDVGVFSHHMVRPFSASPGARAVGRAAARLGMLVPRPRRATPRTGAHNPKAASPTN
jgi:hypothetical protein